MDLLTPGLKPRLSQSTQIIKEINDNSRISFKLKKKFKEVNHSTNDFILNQLAVLNAGQYNNAHSTQEFDTLQSAFQDLYYELNLDNFKYSNVSNVNINKIHDIYKRVNSTYATYGINHSLNELVNSYTLLIINSNLSNALIYKTLILKNNLIYWEEMSESNLNKVLYFVQTSPAKLWDFTKYIYGNLQHVSFNQIHTEGTEEDNPVYNIWLRIRGTLSFVVETISNSVMRNNPTVALFATKSQFAFIKSVLKFPLKLINSELDLKIKSINEQIDISESNIDSLLKIDLDSNHKTISTIQKILNVKPETNENANIQSVLGKLVSISFEPDQASQKPSAITRYWPLLFLLVRYGPAHGYNLYNNKDEVVSWFKLNFVDTIVGFFKNWLIKPISDMLGVLRQDEGLSITSKESLKSDLDSLERMIVDFVKDENLTDLNTDQIHQLIQIGDLTPLMSKYESEIRSPVKSLIKGSLIRSILIQIQKAKVDGGLATNGIDKLLKSQQLVFGIVSISPSLFIVYQLWLSLISPKPIMVNGKQVNILCLKSLNTIENLLILLNNGGEKNNYEGKLLIEIINLIIISKLLIPKQLQKDWVRDLNELNNGKYDLQTKLSLVRKVWNVYGGYFRG